ncbi:ABC transporter substrate-binding protein [Schaalia hyovaginalis]|uniref:ABC transporter substrate-binding protein n=1 Tax=Schaalia hyovaginalis TaxID=29316 RepID=UPI002A8039DA|nr:ABC transporter substrate-binding protein [Schaalia hyovaginalis]MDY4491719.1 ABC transporter substrate-binding protein [Schaalia hyovaginalis]
MKMFAKVAGVGAAFSFVLAGCAQGGTAQESGAQESGSSAGVVSLEFWHGYTEADGKVLDSLVEEFNASHPGVTITPVTKPWGTLLDTALPALTAGEGPHIMALPPENIPTYASKGALVPLDEWYSSAEGGVSRLNEQAIATGDADGKRYGAPLSFTPLTMFYNKAMFDAAGVAVPTTWDEWVDAAKRLTVDEDGDGKPEIYGLALQDNATVGNGVWMSLLKSGGGDVVDPQGKVVVDSPENLATLEYWSRAVVEDKISPTGLTGVNGDELFKSGKVAMTLGGPWLATVAQEAGIDYGIATLPAGPAGIKASALAVDMSITARAEEKERAAALEFFSWFYERGNMIKWSLASGWPPLTSEVTPEDVSENQVVAALAAQSQYGVALLPGVIPQADVLKELDIVTQKTLAGGAPADLLKDAQKAMSDKLSE